MGDPKLFFRQAKSLGLIVLLAMSQSNVAIGLESTRQTKLQTGQGTAFKIADGVWMTAKHVSNGCTSTLVEIGADTLQVNKEIAHDSADMSILITEEPDFASSLEIVKALPSEGDFGFLYGYPDNQAVNIKQSFLGTKTLTIPIGRRTSATQEVAFWVEVTRRPGVGTGSPRLAGASGSPILNSQGGVVGLHIASIPRRGRTFSIAPASINDFIQSKDINADGIVAETLPANDSAAAWLINGGLLRDQLSVTRVFCSR